MAIGLGIATLTACSGPAEAKIPDAQSGRLIRIYNQSGWVNSSAKGWANSGLGSGVGNTDLSQPMALTIAPDGDLLFFQPESQAVVGLKRTGQPTVAPAKAKQFRVPYERGVVAAMATTTDYLLISNVVELSVLDRVSGASAGTVVGPHAFLGDSTVPTLSAAFLSLATGTVVQFGDHWLQASDLASTKRALTDVAAPIPGIVAAAQQGTGAVLITATDLVTLDANARPTSSVPYALPARVAGYIITAAAGDGTGGLLVTLTSGSTTSASSAAGAVVQIGNTGVTTLLAYGTRDNNPDGQCDNANLPALQSHLQDPTSIRIWQDRIVISDTGCGSLLELPAP